VALITPSGSAWALKKNEGDQRQADQPSAKLLVFPYTRQTYMPSYLAASRLERQMHRKLQESVAADRLLSSQGFC
jgi:hypothetical protein